MSQSYARSLELTETPFQQIPFCRVPLFCFCRFLLSCAIFSRGGARHALVPLIYHPRDATVYDHATLSVFRVWLDLTTFLSSFQAYDKILSSGCTARMSSASSVWGFRLFFPRAYRMSINKRENGARLQVRLSAVSLALSVRRNQRLSISLGPTTKFNTKLLYGCL